MIIDVTDATFEAEALVKSQTTPVVVDFWAPWCGPCKTLTPILEKAVTEANGSVILAKVNIDENQQVASAFRVQSVPSVFGLFEGQLVDSFTGAQPEPQIKQFISKLVDLGGGPNGAAVLEQLVAVGDEPSLRKALEMQPDYKPAVLRLAHLLVMQGEGSDAIEILGRIPADDDTAPLAAAAQELAMPADEASKVEARLAELLPTVKADDDARKQFLDLLDELSIARPEEAASWRRKLSTSLF